MSARPAASDQIEEARIQTVKSASAPAATASPALHPSHGEYPAVRRRSRPAPATRATTPVVEAKNPPARNARKPTVNAGAANLAARSTLSLVIGKALKEGKWGLSR